MTDVVLVDDKNVKIDVDKIGGVKIARNIAWKKPIEERTAEWSNKMEKKYAQYLK